MTDSLFLAAAPWMLMGIVLGAVMMLAALICGMWLGRRSAPTAIDLDLHTEKVLSAMRGARRYTHGVSDEVEAHQQHLRDLLDKLDLDGYSPETADVGHMLRDIVEANESLQRKLEDAETTLKQQAEEIEGWASEAHTDSLTGLPNRRTFDTDLSKLYAQWRRYDTPVSVMMLDIDYFKKFNDVHGHLAGDMVLKQVGEVLRSTMRESDIVTRFGGEEFAVILTNTAVQNAGMAATYMNAAIREAVFEYEGQPLHVTVSCGVAQAGEHDSPEDLVKRADAALYASKRGGRDCVHLHDGAAIQRVDDGRKPASTGAAVVSGLRDFGQVCDDLRKKLLEVTGCN